MKLHGWLVAALACAGPLTAQSQAEVASALQARSWAAGCANCHGTQGQALPGMAALAGVNRDELTGKLLDFKNGRRPATLMHQIAKGYSDEQLAAIAAYFSTQPRGTQP